MESTFMNFSVDNDTEINANTLGTDDSCLNTAEGTISEQPEIIGFIPLSGKSRPKVAPTNKITAAPPDGEYAEVFSEGIAVVEITKDNAGKVCSILDKSGTHYGAVASETKVRLFFRDIGFQGHYRGQLFCGIIAEVAGNKGYLPHLEGCTQALHADDEYDMLPPWLCPEKDCSPLHSGTLVIEYREWIGYMQKVYRFYRDEKGASQQEAHAVTLETAKILNCYFREKPYNDQQMENLLSIQDLEFDLNDFYSVSTDSKGNTIRTFKRELFAGFLIERYYLTNIGYRAYKYSGGIYVRITEKDCDSLIMEYLKDTTTSKRKEIVQTIFSALGIYANQTTAEADRYYELKSRCKPELVAFANCIYDVGTGRTLDFSPDIIITNRIPFDYVDAEKQENDEAWMKAKETVDNWLDSFSGHNPEKRAVLEEVAGLAMYQKNEGLRRQHTVLIGEKECGKSTFIKMLEELVGKWNCSHVSMKELCSPNNRFSSSSLVDALINTYGDISSDGIKETEQIKNLCTSDTIHVEQKYQPAKPLEWNGKMIFAGNNLPAINDPALISRFEFIPCNANYSHTGGECRPDIHLEMSTNKKCMEYWCYLAVQGLKRFIRNNYMHTYCKEIEQYRAAKVEKADPAVSFARSVPDSEIDGHETGEVYNKFIDYCVENFGLSENSAKIYTKNKITMLLKNRGYDVVRRSVNNDKIQVYVKCS